MKLHHPHREKWRGAVPELALGAKVVCQLAPFSHDRCDGRLVRVHLLPRQLLKRNGYADLVDDPRTWVVGCGGIMGNAGHHGQLDQSRTLRIPREAIPAETEALAEELGLSWWLGREYGERL